MLPFALVITVLTSACRAESLPQLEPGKDPFAKLRRQMVAVQLAGRDIRDEEVLRVMMRVPRHLFVGEKWREYAYADHPLPIGEDQTISQPYIVAYMTQALQLEAGERVLEVGTGSGYQAAVLGELAAEVYTIEIVPELAQKAGALLNRLGYENIHVRTGAGYFGWPQEAPFDAIIVTAAPEKIPQTLIQHLRPGGRMAIPIGRVHETQTLVRVTKDAEGNVSEQAGLPVAFVPIVAKKFR